MLNTLDLVPFVLLGVKIMIIIAFGADLLFSVIFLQKIKLLSKIIETTVSPWVSLGAIFNVILTLLFLLGSIFII